MKTAATPAAPIVPYVPVEAAAQELNATPLAVKRLIARSRLKAVQLGEGGQWRVSLDSVTAYIAGGCVDLAMPPTDGRWFAGDEYAAARFYEDITAACQPQVLRDEVVAKLIAKLGPGESLTVPLTATPAVLAIANAKPSTAFLPPGTKAPYASRAQQYVCEQLRNAALRLCQADPRQQPLGTLYRSPTDYLAIVGAASTAVGESEIGFGHQHLVPQNAANQWETVRYVLPLSTITKAADLTRAAALAF
jgi:hypothetical protein